METKVQTKVKWTRHVRKFVWATAGVLLLLLVSQPVWFPWIARPALEHIGLHYESYVRQGLSGFQLNGVTADWDPVQFQAKRIDCALPTTWLWRKFSSHAHEQPVLLVHGGILSFSTQTNPPSDDTGQIDSSGETLDEVQQIGFLLKKYVPAARLTGCAIDLPATRVLVPEAEWRGQSLQSQFRATNWAAPLQLDIRLADRQALALSLEWKAHRATLQGTFTRQSNQWDWRGQFNWLTNRAKTSAEFTTNSWWPARGRLDAPQVSVPASQVRLKGYQALTTALSFDLVSNRFDLQATGFALPTAWAAVRGLPPLHASLQLRGDPDSVVLEQFQLQAPFAQATLTNELGIKRTGQLENLAARLRLSVNLDKLPGRHGNGRADGELRVELNAANQPVAHFNLTGEHVDAWGFKTQSVQLEGRFVWPVLTLDNLNLRLADGSRFSADGGIDLTTQELQTTRWRFEGKLPDQIFPALNYRALEASGTLRGALTNLAQTGDITVDGLAGKFLKPAQAHARWQAEGGQLTSAQIKLAAGDSELTVEGSGGLGPAPEHEVNGTLRNIQLRQGNQTIYSLQQPCAISFRPSVAGEQPPQWQLRVDHFDWRSDDHEKKVGLTAQTDWPDSGNVDLHIRRASLDDFTNFVRITTGNIEVQDLALAANWSNSPVQLTVGTTAMVSDRAGRTFRIHAQINGGEDLDIQDLSAHSDFAPALTLTGTLPLQIIPSAGKNWLVMDKEKPVALEARSDTGTNETWLPFGSAGKLVLNQAHLLAQAKGTPAKPVVGVNLKVGRLRWQAQTNNLLPPRADDLNLCGTITPGLIKLEALGFDLDGQPVSASGQCPLPENFWTPLWSHKNLAEVKLPDWRTASGQLRVQNARLSALSRYVPEVLAPEGVLNLALKLDDGGKLDGWLAVTNAATRSLGSLPPIRNINARLKFNGVHASLDQCDAELGGQPLQISGRSDFPSDGPLAYQIHLTGTNLPLARRPDFLLRGDLDLSLQGGSQAPTALDGKVNLRHGLLVRYLSDLLWIGPRRPAVRPPYFSVTNQPFANWKLGVNIQGDHFLHVQTPVFSCVASADANLEGTLETPVLTGGARINSGQIKFPFGTLQVNEGRASLNGNDPRGPDLDFHASGTAYNYDVRMDVTGPASDANVLFSSTPPLNSEEILLLLTAGQIPQNEYAFSTEARAGRLATFLGKDWLGRFTGDLGGQPRWIIRSGEHISEQGRLTYSVEYRITDRWSIIGDYDQYDQYNANLKWRIISR